MSVRKLLEISNLSVSFEKSLILNDLNLNIGIGETHVIMGPNGAGKSTLAKVLVGDNSLYSYSGGIYYDGCDLFSMTPEELSLKGIFLSFQHPVEISGLSNFQFFKSFINCKRKYNKLDSINTSDFLVKVKKNMKFLNIKENFLNRFVNEGFSGGERKKNEMLQMLLLDPRFVILDEIDSGLDIDSLKRVFDCLNVFKNKKNSILIITHNNSILEYIDVDFVHILNNGKISKTGDKRLVLNIKKTGYSFIN